MFDNKQGHSRATGSWNGRYTSAARVLDAVGEVQAVLFSNLVRKFTRTLCDRATRGN